MASTAALSRLQSAAGSLSAADVVRHDDARLSDARTPTTHTHLPIIVSAGTITDGSTWTIDSSTGTLFRATAGGAGITLAAPTNPVDGSQINLEILASAGTSITLNAAILLTSGVTSPIAVAAGKRWFGGLRYITGVGWFLLASTVQS